ncbi:hemerythrin [Tindallia magadiensis]|uniref:Hemerythrin n=1 Tax=Tindallia magadiensis TaxID=69895 RepID=A0A1I3H2J7_9FIRM|nr:hemerythrin family protein [Tindallia magadiensis]SFI29944.1 hemerythrin [Tindallia magadiensis]
MMWKERYRIGVETIDEQHEELFQRVQDFLAVINGSEAWEDRKAKVEETMRFMEDYAGRHFSDEEKLFQEINYPEADSHKKAHADFAKMVKEYKERFKNGMMEDDVQEFGGRLMSWLIMHVGKEDQKLGDFINREV